MNKAPFDQVVSFVTRFAPAKERTKTRILEVGCGSGNNLLWCAEEGFDVTGIDMDEKALEFAYSRFNARYLHADLHKGNLTDPLIWGDSQFDMVIDRGALSYLSRIEMIFALSEVKRVLVPGGRFFFSPYGAGSDQRLLDYEKHLHAETYSTIESVRLLSGWKILEIQEITRHWYQPESLHELIFTMPRTMIEHILIAEKPKGNNPTYSGVVAVADEVVMGC
jgi:SAM-dependent methyltransferase